MQITKSFSLEIAGQRVPVQVVREHRYSVRAAVGKKSVILRLPIQSAPAEIALRIEWLKNWLEHKAQKNPDILARFLNKTYENGQEIQVSSRKYRLEISYTDQRASSGRLHNGIIQLKISRAAGEATIATLLSRLIAKDFYAEIIQRVQELNAQHFQVAFRRVSLKYNQSNWGSCSIQGNINLSTRLLFAPDAVRDYVIIHELAHLLEHNHSNRFWRLVAEAIPDYQTHERWLKENGHLCRF